MHHKVAENNVLGNKIVLTKQSMLHQLGRSIKTINANHMENKYKFQFGLLCSQSKALRPSKVNISYKNRYKIDSILVIFVIPLSSPAHIMSFNRYSKLSNLCV